VCESPPTHLLLLLLATVCLLCFVCCWWLQNSQKQNHDNPREGLSGVMNCDSHLVHNQMKSVTQCWIPTICFWCFRMPSPSNPIHWKDMTIPFIIIWIWLGLRVALHYQWPFDWHKVKILIDLNLFQ
jgi:hypothetical protein